ncbi:sulfuric ester hydrolase [Aureococcus anophagefferens]|nr:sulfuric ester hydrolase [Aureococcus anophagefferens]
MSNPCDDARIEVVLPSVSRPGIQGPHRALPVDFRPRDGGLAPPRIIAGMPQAELKTKARAKNALKQHNGTARGDLARASPRRGAGSAISKAPDEVARLRRANASAGAVEAALRALPSYKPPKRRLRRSTRAASATARRAVRFGRTSALRARFNRRAPAARRRLADEPRRPDILFVLVDDVGWNDVPYHRLDDKKRGGPVPSDMPEVGKLARAGVRLEWYYTNSICAPSRSAIQTGRYPMRFGAQHSCYSMGQGTHVPETEEFMGDAFRRVGYETWAFGKWHLGNDAPSHATTTTSASTARRCTRSTTTSFSNRIVHDWHRDGDDSTGPGVDGVHADLLIGRDFADRLARRRSDRPLFTYFAPHLIHESKGHSDGVENVPRTGGAPADVGGRYYSPWRVLGGMFRFVDAIVGNVSRAHFAAHEDNILVFTSDNGAASDRADRDRGGNRPLRGAKHDYWEGGIRVPAFVVGGGLRRGAVLRRAVAANALQKLEADVSTCWGLPHAVPPGEQEDCDNFPMKRDCHFDPDAKFISYKPGWCADHGSDEYHAKKLGEVPAHKDLAVEAGLWNRLPADEWV